MIIHNENFHTAGVKRQILVVDDDVVNREILGEILKQNYSVLYAENGQQALEIIRENQETLSLILLDLIMPVMDGKEVLERVTEDVDLSHIPVIVLTTDQQSEVECLSLGAIDFIPKPYPQVDVILARVRRTIELSEDRRIIQVTERDTLTGLYTKEFFFRYAEQFDNRHKGMDTDAILVDVNHFHMINERYGKVYGDRLLRQIADNIRKVTMDHGGIVSRKEADTFLIYCPHRDDYENMLETISSGIDGEEVGGTRIHLRMGVYSVVDKSLDIELRFDRAKTAADTVHGSFTKMVGIYDDDLNQRELYAEQLVEDFSKALETNQFLVYFQPKFDIRPRNPILTGAEALVRWNHPKFGMISPSVFVPLFENNGLIQKLDEFVWRETARQLHDWKERFGYSVPVSVNVSRVDIYDPNLLDTLNDILKSNKVTTDDLYLEITESAYTTNSEQIIDKVKGLRHEGFHIEMDDFGTGYSSLNMISTLPIDALKLDMQFIRNAFKEGGSTRMIEVIIDIADFLGVPSIAEGVETEEQLKALRMMGCAVVQGYYFSKPIPPEDFERFIIEGKTARAELDAAQKAEKEEADAKLAAELSSMRQANDQKIQQLESSEKTGEKHAERKGISMRAFSFFLTVISILISIGLFIINRNVNRGYQASVEAGDRFVTAQQAAFNMESLSDYLTDRVRLFVVSGDVSFMNEFFEEVDVTKRRERALSDLEYLMGNSSGSSAYQSLSNALTLSNELVQREYLAMRLRLMSLGYSSEKIPAVLSEIPVDQKYASLSAEELKNESINLVFDDYYMEYKNRIKANVSQCTQDLIAAESRSVEKASGEMLNLLKIQSILTASLLVVVFILAAFISTQVRKPLTNLVKNIRAQLPDKPTGAEELRFVSRTYNDFLADSRKVRAQLTYETAHDPVTGLFNRGAYDLLIRSVDINHVALMIFDIDQFQKINEIYGHEVGDLVLKRVAGVLKRNFRSVDMIFRMGEDEFVVILTRMNSSLRPLVHNKFLSINKQLQNPEGEIPSVSVCAGAAFSDRQNPQDNLYNDAESALRKARESGRRECVIY